MWVGGSERVTHPGRIKLQSVGRWIDLTSWILVGLVSSMERTADSLGGL